MTPDVQDDETHTYDDALELVIPPNRWFVDLTTGDTIEVLAHSYSIQGDRCVYSLLFRGTPNIDVTMLSLPVSLVAGIDDMVEPDRSHPSADDRHSGSQCFANQ
jgi:hypothetical protein